MVRLPRMVAGPGVGGLDLVFAAGQADGHRGEQADTVTGGQGEIGPGRAGLAAAQDGHRGAARRPGEIAELAAGGGRPRGDGDLGELVSGVRYLLFTNLYLHYAIIV